MTATRIVSWISAAFLVHSAVLVASGAHLWPATQIVLLLGLAAAFVVVGLVTGGNR